MLERYSDPTMRQLWNDVTKFKQWLDVELAVLRTRASMGMLRPEICQQICAHAGFNVDRIRLLEARYQHDMIAFIEAVYVELDATGLGKHKQEFHKGLTSYDVEDPALILLLRTAAEAIRGELKALERELREKAWEHQWTLMIARTHGQSAEPTTFGHLLLVYAEAVHRSISRLDWALDEEVAEGKISGAVGTYAGLDPALEIRALALLNLMPAKAETQILQRDRHAMLLAILAIAAGTIEQMCRTFWLMMRSDVAELEEPRTARQRGSSAMAHKRNPILTERLIGLARQVRACAHAASENIATAECRDISQSSVERHILPDATSILHYMALQAKDLVRNLVVRPERMRENLENALGVWASQPVRIALMEAGIPHDTAYEYLQDAAFAAERDRKPMSEILCQKSISADDDRTAAVVLGRDHLAQYFDPRAYIEAGIEHIFRRATER